MKKYVKISENAYTLSEGGFLQSGDTLSLQLVKPDEAIEETMAVFENAEGFEIVNEDGGVIAAFSGYKTVKSVQFYSARGHGDILSLNLEKNSRLDALEEAVDMLTEAILEMGE